MTKITIQEKSGKSFMSMFDSDDDDGPVYDSQLNTLPGNPCITLLTFAILSLQYIYICI